MDKSDQTHQGRELAGDEAVPAGKAPAEQSQIEKLTTAQEDYLETTLRLEAELSPELVRITDIANALGTKLPTVSRTVNRLTEMGLLIHPARGRVELSDFGRTLAQEITHRHTDLVEFFVTVLGLPAEIAETDTCQIEHGLSPQAAQRLHEFIEYIESLSQSERKVFERFRSRAGRKNRAFKHLPQNKAAGWRG